MPVGAERAEVDGEIARGQEVQRPAHRPDLDQRALAPERALERLHARALDPRPEREGGAGEKLGVQPADPPGDAQLAAARRAPMQVVAFEPQGPRLFPPELHALEFTANRSRDTSLLSENGPSVTVILPLASRRYRPLPAPRKRWVR